MKFFANLPTLTFHTIKYTGKNVISCLRGKDQFVDNDDKYGYRQNGGDDDIPWPGAKDYKSCTDFAKAQFQHQELVYADAADDDDDYDENYWIKLQTSVQGCRQSGYSGYRIINGAGKVAVEYTGTRCVNDAGVSGASFTGSSMAALFGLLCISLTLW